MKTVLEYLQEARDMAAHNKRCYSKVTHRDGGIIIEPVKGFEKEYSEAIRDCQITDELTAMVKRKEATAERTPLAIPASGSIYEKADCVMENLLDQVRKERRWDPDDETLRGKEDALIFLAKLNQRESQVARFNHFGDLANLARMMETDYLEFTPEKVKNGVCRVKVLDGVLHKYVAEFLFIKRDPTDHWVLDHCSFYR